jgi:hypothetical protein
MAVAGIATAVRIGQHGHMPDASDPSPGPWRPESFEGVSSFPEVSDWHVRPEPPLEIVYAGLYQGGDTGFLVVRDVAGRKWPFCLDEFGRLRTGSHPAGEHAAFVRPGSPLEAEVVDLMARTAQRIAREPQRVPELAVLPSLYERTLVRSDLHRPRPGWYSIQT